MLAAWSAALLHGSPPVTLETALAKLRSASNDDSQIRLELSVRAPWDLYDYSPRINDGLESEAEFWLALGPSATLRVAWAEVSPEVEAILTELLKSSWRTKAAKSGISNTYFRVVGRKGTVYLAMFISLSDSTVLFDGQWYEVERRLLASLLDTIQSLTVALIRASQEPPVSAPLERWRERRARLGNEILDSGKAPR